MQRVPCIAHQPRNLLHLAEIGLATDRLQFRVTDPAKADARVSVAQSRQPLYRPVHVPDWRPPIPERPIV